MLLLRAKVNKIIRLCKFYYTNSIIYVCPSFFFRQKKTESLGFLALQAAKGRAAAFTNKLQRLCEIFRKGHIARYAPSS